MDLATLDSVRIALDLPGQLGVALALILVMFGVALGLRIDDFTLLLKKPLVFGAGVAAQLLGLPLMTLGLVSWLSPPPSIALGMFVVACCPGGAASNLMSYLARGNVAYSVALTATSSLLAAVSTPVSIVLWSKTYRPTANLLASIDFNTLAFLVQTTLLLAVPLCVGMILAARVPELAKRLRRRMAIAGVAALGGVIVYGTLRFFPILAPALPVLAALGILHNALAFALGYAVGRTMCNERPTRRALVFEIGIQNSGLAIVILIGQLHGFGGAAAIAAFWGVWHLIAGGLIVIAYRMLDKRGRMG